MRQSGYFLKLLTEGTRQTMTMVHSLLRNFRKRSTSSSVLVVMAITAIIYFLFQLSSMRIITDHNLKIARSHLSALNKNYDKKHRERYITDELARTKLKYSSREQRQSKKSSPVRREQAELKDKEQNIEHNIQSIKKLIPSDLPSGVNPKMLNHYIRGVKRKFICITSKEVISYRSVNDDYCDCADGSDEPGTSACESSNFFCDYQLKDEEFSILSNRVNDGICDCCDGSDEWDGVLVPTELRLHGNQQKYSLPHAPCHDRCLMKEKEKIERLKIQMTGIQIKKEYLEKAGKYPIQNSNKFGPGGIFYKLSLKCFDWKEKEYEYAVCPFKHVKQQKFQQPEIDLGHLSEWVSARPGSYQLKMTGGDTQLCPGVRRQILLDFHCGSEDKVLNLREDEKCHYVVDFATPAAC